MVEKPAWKAPSEDAGSTLPFDAKTYQNILNAIAADLMIRAPIALTVTGTSALAGTTPDGAANPLPGYVKGLVVWWEAPNDCPGGGIALAVDELLGKDLTDKSGNPIGDGAWLAGDVLMAIYDGARFRLQGHFNFDGVFGSLGMAPGFLSGLATSSNATDGNNDIDITSGFARSEDNSRDIVLSAGLTKKLDEVWAQGTNAGAILQSANLAGTIAVANASALITGTGTAFLTDFIVGDVIQTAGGQARRITVITSDTAMTAESNFSSDEVGVAFRRGGKAPSSCYRIFLIRRDSDGAADVAASTRDTPANLPAGWSKFARIGYVLTASDAKNVQFDSYGRLVLLRSAIHQISAAGFGITAGTTATITTPLPPRVIARLLINISSTGGARCDYTVFPAALGSPAGLPQFGTNSADSSEVSLSRGEVDVPLDASSAFKTLQVGAAGVSTAWLDLLGWIDDRGASIGGISGNPNVGRVRWPSSLTPAALSADTDDYAPSGIETATVLRLDYGADGRKLTGLIAGADGDIIELDNVGTTLGILMAEAVTTTAESRFAFASNVYHWPGQTIRLRYDGDAQRWRTPRGEPKADIQPTSLSSDQNDYNPAGLLAGAESIGQASSVEVRLTGLQALPGGKIVTINNINALGGPDLILLAESALSTTTNRFTANARVQPGRGVQLQYDAASSRWRVLGGARMDAVDAMIQAAMMAYADRKGWPLYPSFSINFLPPEPGQVGCKLPSWVSFSRAGSKRICSANGNWVEVPAGVCAASFDPTTGAFLGASIEGLSTNLIRNNSMQGAVAGSPGTLPTNWTITVPTGLTRTISVETVNGVDVLRVRYQGTATSTAMLQIRPEAITQAAGVTGNNYSTSAFFQFLSTIGLSSAGALRLEVWEYNSGSSFLAGSGAAGTIAASPIAAQSSLDRYNYTRQLTEATTAYCQQMIRTNTNIASGTVCDFEFRIGWNQHEKRSTTTTPIRTTGSSVTRAADVMDVSSLGSWFNPAEGAIYVRGRFPYSSSDAQVLLALDDGTFSEHIALVTDTSLALAAQVVDGGSLIMNGAMGSLTAGTEFAAILAYKADDCAWSLNGAAAGTDVSATLPTVTGMKVGRRGPSTSPMYGHLKQIAVFGRRPSNTNLATMSAA
jgi:hypothetical protein